MARQARTCGGPSGRVICSCHGEPCYWQKDARARNGEGYWYCAVKARERQRYLYRHTSYGDRKNAHEYAKYGDPLYRIPKLMKEAARKRAATLSRRRAELRGEVSQQGRNRPSLEPNP